MHILTQEIHNKNLSCIFHYQSFCKVYCKLKIECNNGYLSTVELLVARGANINATDKFKRSALHWAVRYNFVELVEYLLSIGINSEIIDVEERTAFEIAKSMANIDMMAVLNEYHKTKTRDKMMTHAPH